MLKYMCTAFFLFALSSQSEGILAKKNCEEREKSLALLELAKDSITKAKEAIPECKDNSTQTNSSSCGRKERTSAYIDIALRLIEETKQRFPTCDIDVTPDEKPDDKRDEKSLPVDCLEVQQRGHSRSGVYRILPGHSEAANKSFEVFCDLELDGGGWTVIQRRGPYPSQPVDFYRDWDAYKRGFGNISEEFWLGNDNIYLLTNQTNNSVRIDLEHQKGQRAHALYKNFSIENESDMYKLHIYNYSGNAGDSMLYHNGMKFSTKDKKNDKSLEISCAVDGSSGWWFNACSYCNLNGIRQLGEEGNKYMYWFHWRREILSLNAVEIKLRRP